MNSHIYNRLYPEVQHLQYHLLTLLYALPTKIKCPELLLANRNKISIIYGTSASKTNANHHRNYHTNYLVPLFHKPSII